MTDSALQLRVWRESCRHLELSESIDAIGHLIGSYCPADHVLVRQLDLVHNGLETVAVASCRPNVPGVAPTRTNLNDAAFHTLLSWCRSSAAAAGVVPGHALLDLISPPGYHGHCVASPLHTEEGPLGVVLLVAANTTFNASDVALLTEIREPFEAALANTVRVRELKRVKESLEADKQALLSKLGRHDVADAVVGADTGLRAVMDRAQYIAPTDVPVLILGETGSGKEVLARSVHERSRRARSPLVRVNCGAVSPGLVDMGLLGHEHRGPSGGLAVREGWFERADGGTLFLDEISELSAEAQLAVLRILQGGTFQRVGGQHTLSVDIRLLAATHRNLRERVEQGTFLEELWSRLSVFPIHLPPLRDRREDIPGLAAHFATRAATRLVGMPVPLAPTVDDLDLLLAYDWPGNVRELAAVIERATILGAGRTLKVAAALGLAAPHVTTPPDLSPGPRQPGPSTATLDEAMRLHIEAALTATGGRVEGPRGAARRLRINPHTLRARMRKLGISRGAFRGLPVPNQQPAANIGELDEAMRAHISDALERTAGRIEGPHGAARHLGINPHTLRARMRKLGLVASQFRRRTGPL